MDSGLTTDRRQQINNIAESALRLAPDARAAYLDQACTDAALRRDVETTIALRDASGQVGGATNAEGPTAIFADADTISLSEDEQQKLLDDATIGPYRVLRRIGQGGMGAVYLAERDTTEFRQQVAIKLVKRGMDTEFVLRRFRNERQILAALNHPNIARLLDGGTTADGRPYFVMEYIEGKPLTQYADERRLSTVERLQLFQAICAAIHYAHQNLVIHRDIKPSNILVTQDGTPKLLDFGIAKLLNPDLAGSPIEATAVAVRLMTPEYASPEQVRGETITTASDVYSLGVLLYELLTGHRPYRIGSRAVHDVARVVCEEEPQKPSTAVRRTETYSLADGSATVQLTPESVSRTRDGNPEKLRRRLRGDLDNIVLMAMRKEPARRYASVDQFANDISRHLDGRPVIARTDTFGYRATKFVKRHKAGVLAALLILASLVAGAVATLQQRARAERRFNDVRQLANSFLFEFHDAIEPLPGSTPARGLVVKRALEYLDSLAREAGGDTQLQRDLATAYQKVGDVQGNPFDNNIGDLTGALASYQKAHAIWQELVRRSPASVEDRRGLATSYLCLGDIGWGTGDTDMAVSNYQQGISVAEPLLDRDQLDVPISRQVWRGYRNLAYSLASAGDFNAALASFYKGQALIDKLAEAHPNDPKIRHDLGTSLVTLGKAQAEQGDLATALETFRKALAIDEEFAAAEPNNVSFQTAVAIDHLNLGDAQLLAGNPRVALEHYRKADAIAQPVAAADPTSIKAQRDVGVTLTGMSRALARLNEYAEALPLMQRAAAIYERVAADDPTNPFAQAELAYSHIYVSMMLAKTGRGAEAIELGGKALRMVEDLAVANPTNIEFRGIQAITYALFGDAYAAIAADERQTGRQVERWRAARDWYQRSYEIYKSLKDRGEFISADYGKPEDAAAKLAAAAAALSRLASR